MKILFVTDLHGCIWKYNLLYETAQEYGSEVVINGGDLLPNDGDMLTVQSNFIDFYLDSHFARFNNAGIHYLGLDRCANGLEVGSRAVYNFLKKDAAKAFYSRPHS